jgi:hypothetical protein
MLCLLKGVGPVTAGAAFQHAAGNNRQPSSLATFKAPPSAKEESEQLASLW